MNIGIVTTWFERGAAYVSRQFMDVLQKTDNVFIYARGGEDYAIGNSYWDLENVTWGKRSKIKSSIFGSTYMSKSDFIKWVSKNKIEAVLFNEQRYFQPLLWCKELGVKSIAYIDYYTEDTIPLFDAYDCVICNTKRHHFAFRNHHNAQYLRWGTNISLYKPSGEVHDTLTFFHSAGMAPFRKGTDILLEAYYKVKNRKDSKLIIHSQASLVDCFPSLSQVISEMLEDGTLEIVEKTVSAPGLYSMGDVYIYPSRLDGIGLTLMEAISSGLAIITTDNAPMNEFVDKSFGDVCGVEYYYCRQDAYYWPISVVSVSQLASLIDRYIDEKDRVTEMKHKAREYATATLDFSKNCRELSNIIRNTQIHKLETNLEIKIKKYDRRWLSLVISPILNML